MRALFLEERRLPPGFRLEAALQLGLAAMKLGVVLIPATTLLSLDARKAGGGLSGPVTTWTRW